MSDSKVLLKIRLDGELYEINKLTLGEGRMLKREFGLADLARFNLTDPDTLTGLLVCATKRKHPDWTETQILAHVEGLDFLSTEEVEDDEGKEDPTDAGTGSAGDEQAPPGTPATIPATPGTPLSDESTG